MSSIGNVILALIEKHTKDDVIDIMEMAESLGINVKFVEMDRSTDVAVMKQEEEDNRPKIELNIINSIEDNYTLVALLLADSFIAPQRASNEGFKYEVFFLKELRHYRLTRTLLLATRLAIPEEVINQIDEVDFDIDAYIAKAKYLPSFVNNMVKDSNASFLVINNLLGVMPIDQLIKGHTK